MTNLNEIAQFGIELRILRQLVKYNVTNPLETKPSEEHGSFSVQ